jgi:hypothetical protein
MSRHTLRISVNSLTHFYSRHRPQRPQVRLRGLAQVGPIDNSSCIFFPIDPAISPSTTITRGGCLFFNPDHKNAILLMPPRVRHDHLPRAVSSTDTRPKPATRNSLYSIAQSLQSRSHRNSWSLLADIIPVACSSCFRILSVFSQGVSTL